MEKNRGKGSERILLLPESESSLKEPQYPVRLHGAGDDIPNGTIDALLRRFDIDKKDFWNRR